MGKKKVKVIGKGKNARIECSRAEGAGGGTWVRAESRIGLPFLGVDCNCDQGKQGRQSTAIVGPKLGVARGRTRILSSPLLIDVTRIKSLPGSKPYTTIFTSLQHKTSSP